MLITRLLFITFVVSLAQGIPVHRTTFARSRRLSRRTTEAKLSNIHLDRQFAESVRVEVPMKKPSPKSIHTRSKYFPSRKSTARSVDRGRSANRSKSTIASKAPEAVISPNGKRKVTPELRDFWLELDHRKSKRIAETSSKVKGDSKNDSTKSTSGTSLSENFDYSDYYYYDYSDGTISALSDSVTDGEKGESSINDHVEPIEVSSFSQSTELPKSIVVTELPKTSLITELPKTSVITELPKTSVITELPKTIVITDLPKTDSTTEFSIVGVRQGRKIAQANAEEKSLSNLVAASAVQNPVTARDHFKMRLKTNDQDANKPKDILKEFPIFRQLKRSFSETMPLRKLSLHERLRERFVSPKTIENEDKSTTTESTPVTTTPVATTPVETTPVATTPVETTPVETTPVATTPVTTTPVTITQVTTTQVTTTSTTEQPETTTPSSPPIIPDTTTIQTSTETSIGGIQKEITFSTSETHKVVESSHALKGIVKLKSQLGMAPLGEAPFGVAPFGEMPMGELPFGVAPEGIAPHGNISILNSTFTNSTDDGITGDQDRYHVQVVSPDGSINGDYVVVDPVTGDLNGVRYDVAKDVDPLLVQKALLNFLGLDPRFKPSEPQFDDTNSDPPEETSLPPDSGVIPESDSAQSFITTKPPDAPDSLLNL